MLIPIQAISAFQLSTIARQQDVAQFEAASRRIDSFAKQVKATKDYDSLSRLLQATQSITIRREDRKLPLEKTKLLLLNKVKEAQAILLERRRPDIFGGKVWLQIQLTLRNTLVCLGYAIGFSALAQRPRAEAPLLQEILAKVVDKLENQLHNREIHLQAIEQGKADSFEPDDFSIHPDALSRMHEEGVLDPRWLQAEQASADPATTATLPFSQDGEDQTGVSPASDSQQPLQSHRPGWLGLLSGWARPARNPGQNAWDYMHTLSNNEDDPAPTTGPSAKPLGASPRSSATEPSRSASKPGGRITDLHYFEQLAKDESESENPPTPEQR